MSHPPFPATAGNRKNSTHGGNHGDQTPIIVMSSCVSAAVAALIGMGLWLVVLAHCRRRNHRNPRTQNEDLSVRAPTTNVEVQTLALPIELHGPAQRTRTENGPLTTQNNDTASQEFSASMTITNSEGSLWSAGDIDVRPKCGFNHTHLSDAPHASGQGGE